MTIRRSAFRCSVFLVALLFAGCGQDDGSTAPASAGNTVTGSVGFREPVELPPGSRLDVVLLDTSRADAPAIELARQVIAEPGNDPVAFALPYDPAAIEPGHSYAVRATIRRGDRLLFTTDTHYPVLTPDGRDQTELLLVPVP